MDMKRVMVALALWLGACGAGGGSVDAGGTDAARLDLGAEDAGDLGTADADASSDTQCAGQPDLSPCDDGRAFTVDACIGGECVGRACSSAVVDRRCNTPQLTLESCEGVPFEDGTACDDEDAFTVDDVCTAGVCGGDPCACPPGMPCCVDGCAFLASDVECDEWVEVECVGGQGCGNTYQSLLHRTFCSGSSPACDGLEEVTGGAVTSCAGDRFCTDGTYVEPNDDGRDVTFGCVPSC